MLSIMYFVYSDNADGVVSLLQKFMLLNRGTADQFVRHFPLYADIILFTNIT